MLKNEKPTIFVIVVFTINLKKKLIIRVNWLCAFNLLNIKDFSKLNDLNLSRVSKMCHTK